MECHLWVFCRKSVVLKSFDYTSLVLFAILDKCFSISFQKQFSTQIQISDLNLYMHCIISSTILFHLLHCLILMVRILSMLIFAKSNHSYSAKFDLHEKIICFACPKLVAKAGTNKSLRKVVKIVLPFVILTELFDSLWPGGAIQHHRTWSILGQVMACCLRAPNHYLYQCRLIISKVLWHSCESIIIRFEETNQ